MPWAPCLQWTSIWSSFSTRKSKDSACGDGLLACSFVLLQRLSVVVCCLGARRAPWCPYGRRCLGEVSHEPRGVLRPGFSCILTERALFLAARLPGMTGSEGRESACKAGSDGAGVPRTRTESLLRREGSISRTWGGLPAGL